MNSLASLVQNLIDASKEKARQMGKVKRDGTLPTDAKKVLLLKEITVSTVSLDNQHRPLKVQVFVVAGHNSRQNVGNYPTSIVRDKE